MSDQSETSSHVELTDQGLIYHQAEGVSRTILWDNLRSVLIQTTDEGPFIDDVWWVLSDEDGDCIIPQGANGETELFLRLQQLPGFDNDAVIAAMGSVDNKQFVCWQRQ